MKPTEPNLDEYRQVLLEWWRDGGARTFAWRDPANRTPYRSVMAELMLRRTRADQVDRVYRAFIDRYPTLTDALDADPEEVRKILYPLGLAWRTQDILNLLAAVRDAELTDFPVDAPSLEQLPGIGDYVSNAVACFAGGSADATLIDTNVVRVLGRIFGLDTSGEARRRQPMRTLAARAVDRENVADYHYAILDFAACVCIAQRPRCTDCPVGQSGRCDYYEKEGKMKDAE